MRAPLKTTQVGWAPSLNIIQANPSNPTPAGKYNYLSALLMLGMFYKKKVPSSEVRKETTVFTG